MFDTLFVSMLTPSFFFLGSILVFSALCGFILFRLRQPLLLAYVLAGVVVGPHVLGIVTEETQIVHALSEVGVALLLFTVGLGLNWRSVKEVGVSILAIGLLQVALTSAVGVGLAHLLGFDWMVSLYLGVAFSFASTILIVKLLTDKEEMDTLYGKLSIGILLVQDVVAMILLLVLGSIGGGEALLPVLGASILKMAVLLPVVGALSVWVVPRVMAYAAKSHELLLLFALSWCFLFAGVLAKLGFSVEMGALFAGITLSGTLFQKDVVSRVKPVRDFCLMLFFVVLGTRLGFETVGESWLPALIFSLFVLIGNPLLVLGIMRIFGYHPHTGWLTGTTVAQVSEFSYILIAAGIALGHIPVSTLSFASLVGVLTIAVSAYLIQHNAKIYNLIRPLFRFAPSPRLKQRGGAPELILFGAHRVGERLLEHIAASDWRYQVVDLDPHTVRRLREVGHDVIYGDASDHEFLSEISAHQTKCWISTIPDLSVSLELLAFAAHRGFAGTLIVSARTKQDAEVCYAAGASYVIVPHLLGGEKLVELFDQKQTRKRGWEKLRS